MAKVSAAHQAVIDVKNAAERERLAYHHILTAIVTGNSGHKWADLKRVGSVYHQGDSWVWMMGFSRRLRDAVIMETFTNKMNNDKTVRCFFLSDIQNTYYGRSFDSTDERSKFQQLYFHAVEMERIEQNRAA